MKSICIIATVPYAINAYMLEHVLQLCKYYKVTILCNGTRADLKLSENNNLIFTNIEIHRKISLFYDALIFFKIFKILKFSKFDLVHTIMPKSGLIGMLASALARIPVRVHTFTGQVWANKKNIKRTALKIFDKLLASCATHILTDSESQKLFLIANNIVQKNKIQVLASGSICGVNLNKFKPDSIARFTIRSKFKIPNNAFVFLYLGRVTKDKGLLDLANAFKLLIKSHTNAHLFIVGPEEDDTAFILDEMFSINNINYHREDFTAQPEIYMTAADVFCLPSYREGFGSVIIEAAATGLPSIASNIYGITDALVNGKTGILHQPKDVLELYSAMSFFINNPIAVKTMGLAASERVKNYFSTAIVVNAMLDFYKKLLNTPCKI
jgi:glycosyltransferase involved in cell wall biosynthesis